MKFQTQTYSIPDEIEKAFINVDEIENILNNTILSERKLDEVLARALSKQRLSMHDVAVLLKADEPHQLEKIFRTAHYLKKEVYGNRIVLFAPLYIGNKCSNNCLYCGFRISNSAAIRKTLNDDEIRYEVEALLEQGHKRLILVFGEHQQYDARFIKHCVELVYSIRKGNNQIRRININAAPMSVEDFRIVADARIGTFQIFQETYHPDVYKTYHLRGPKADYTYRLLAFDRAMQAGIDDVGIGVLFGLYDWKYEVLSLIRHVNHLEACFHIGPHTISVPRIKDASMLQIGDKYFVSDEDFKRIVAILRLAVPYAGLILTAREPEHLRDECLQYGVSQIDGGTKIEIGAYSNIQNHQQDLNRGQFRINDTRSLREIIDHLIDTGNIPSFCTACYRLGRTGEHFMEISVPGFIKRFCTPNAILTLAEYLLDFAPEETARKGWKLIEEHVEQISSNGLKEQIKEKLRRLQQGERDLYF